MKEYKGGGGDRGGVWPKDFETWWIKKKTKQNKTKHIPFPSYITFIIP